MLLPTETGWFATERHSDATGREPERTAKTRAHYRKESARLIRMSRPEEGIGDVARLAHAVNWFGSQHGKWAPSSIRMFQAALRQGVVDLAWATPIQESRLAALLEAIASPPIPRPKEAPKQTSARKQKELTQQDQRKLVEWLARQSKTSRLLAGLVSFGARAGLRPHEWVSAQLRGNTLIVLCAKGTNGRAVGKFRFLTLVGWCDQELKSLANFLHAFRQAAYAAGCWQVLHERLSKSLTRACTKLGLPKICLYTLRHVGIATAKRWLDPRHVAALAGHVSPETARRSYAKKRSGWNKDRRVVVPDARTVAAVRTPRSRSSTEPITCHRPFQ